MVRGIPQCITMKFTNIFNSLLPWNMRSDILHRWHEMIHNAKPSDYRFLKANRFECASKLQSKFRLWLSNYHVCLNQLLHFTALFQVKSIWYTANLCGNAEKNECSAMLSGPQTLLDQTVTVWKPHIIFKWRFSFCLWLFFAIKKKSSMKFWSGIPTSIPRQNLLC